MIHFLLYTYYGTSEFIFMMIWKYFYPIWSIIRNLEIFLPQRVVQVAPFPMSGQQLTQKFQAQKLIKTVSIWAFKLLKNC